MKTLSPIHSTSWRPHIVSALLGLCAAPLLAQTLTLHYQERPLYSQADASGQVTGLVATPAADALGRAGIAFHWALTPNQRQLALIQDGTSLHCGIGWFRTPERATRGKFSLPLSQDQPFAALARADAPLRDGLRPEQALAAAGSTLLLKEGYSYGPQLDALLIGVRTERTHADVAQMVRMLAAGRAAWMIVTPDEARELLAQTGLNDAGLRVLPLVGLQ
ncbi:MAG: hypothetical protein Q8L92_13380, partial [Rubrivivax sp.]|nr:hypothetical protein [Rubrivivax sp.]